MSKTHIHELSVGLVALAIGAVMLLGGLTSLVPDTSAAALNANDLFGGNAASYNGNSFANDAGLGSRALPTTIASIIRVALGFLGVIAVVIILIGGFKWMIAGGQEKGVEDAKKLLIAGIIGLAIVLAAYAIANFVIGSLTTAIANTA